MPYSQTKLQVACKHLRRRDPTMKAVIDRIGPCQIRKKRHHFQSLVTAILSQQISAAAAETVIRNFKIQLETNTIRVSDLQNWSISDLRSVGISRQKAGYLNDLTEAVESGDLRLDRLSRFNDDKVIEKLTTVKGIGVWTAQMFLIFSLGRHDVLPVGDLAIRAAIQKQYELEELPDEATMTELAQAWAPYRSIACWYLWRTIRMD